MSYGLDAAYTEEPDKGKTFNRTDISTISFLSDVVRRFPTEWFYFNGTPEKSKNLFDKFVQHDLSGFHPLEKEDTTLRDKSKKKVAKTLAYFQEHAVEASFCGMPRRFGKTLSTYDLARRMEAVNVL